MQPRLPARLDQLALRATALAVLCAGGFYALAPEAAPPDQPVVSMARHDAATVPPTAAAPVDAEVSTRVQTMLAGTGCPGWIAVANHPEWLAPGPGRNGVTPLPPVADPPAVHLTVDRHAAAVPRLSYPTPLRVAALADDGDDDLLGDVDDLIDPQVGQVDDDDSPTTGANSLGANFNGMPIVPTPAADESDAGDAEEDLLDAGDDLIDEGDDLLGDTEDLVGPQQPEADDRPTDGDDADSLLEEDDDLLVPPPAGRATKPAAPPTTPGGKPAGQSPFARPAPGVGNPHTGPRRAPPSPKKPGPGSKAARGAATAPQTPLERCEFVAKGLYPTATECRTCHEKIYDEWSMSSHAYAMVSPMFHKFEQKINDVAQGTVGYFCYRCHSPAGVSLGISRDTPLWDLPQVAREGITCVACHRVNEFYGRSNGERRIVPGDIHDPVYGSFGGDGVAEAIRQKDNLKLHLSPEAKGPGQAMHRAGFHNPQLGKSDFCITCHQVAVYPGIKLEVVWEQYRASPACRKGVRCQDCHMGRIPGVPSGFESGPAAVVNKKNVNENRRHSNHVFYGPGYSIAHPGIFPFNPKAYRWTMRDWLQFDWRGGWGTKEFEDAVDDGRIHVDFPEVWKEADDRYDARDIIDDNLKKRGHKDQLRAAVMENGSHVDGPYFKHTPARGQPLQFDYVVVNTNEGHNLPTASLGAQPQLWANVALIGPRGNRLWESGYLDSLGDLADIHSADVRHKRIAYDAQLFNLQTMFLITGAKGTDREFYLPVNIDFDQLPFIRPGAQPISVINHPPFIRMEARSLAPLGSRRVPYRVPAELMCEPGRYRLTFRMRSRLEPLYFMRFCGCTPEMMRAMNEGILDFHQHSVEFVVR